MCKTVIRVMSVMLAIGYITLSAPPFVSSENAASAAEETVVAEKNSLSYYEYSLIYGNSESASDSIELAAVNSFGGVKQSYLEREAVYIDGEKCAEWSFTVPNEALYEIYIEYASSGGESSRDYNLSVEVDGKHPFSGASDITLKRVWRDAEKIRQDSRGNDLVPETEEVLMWQSTALTDNTGYSSSPCKWYFTEGEHTIRFAGGEDGFYISKVILSVPDTPDDYKTVSAEYEKNGYKIINNVSLTYQAEETLYKSSRTIYPIYDRGASAVPNDPVAVKRNIIGGSYWKQQGDSISYSVNAPEAGLYCLTFKYRQNTQLDMAVYRSIAVNGEVPFAELDGVAFPYAWGWNNLTLADDDGNPYYIYLNRGENTITVTATVGKWSSVLQSVDDIAARLNTLYRRIIMVTGTTPDSYRDYHLENEIDNLKETLRELSDELNDCAARFNAVNGKKSSQASTLTTAADQLKEFYLKPAAIPKQLSTFRENITSLSDWLQSNKVQQLELDYFMLHSPDAVIPSAKGSLRHRILFSFKRFLAAFGEDYGTISDEGGEEKVISVWINDGRDQAQLWKDVIADGFSSKYGIEVNVNLVNSGIIEAVLAGRAPDVMIGAARGQPVNLACRNALYDLSDFENFDEIKGRFADDALLPYSYNGGVYGLPLTQYFLMMFYRTDIFDELSLSPPNTWNDFMDAAAYLQRNNMKVGLPYTAISASGAVDLGVGAKDLFPSLLLQNGGNYYNEDLTASTLDSDAALKAFRTWTAFYTDYGFDLSYDFVSLFRSGEMPIAIASFTMYGMIDAVATEIHGNWKMALMPGTDCGDGTVNRAGSASGSAVIMLKDAADKKACLQFIDWLTSCEAQADFGNRIEGLLGVSARYATANLEAFEQLNWTKSERSLLDEQRSYITETPEIPGSYYTARCVDNAFRNVVYYGKNTRKSLEEQYEILNTEISRKISELQ